MTRPLQLYIDAKLLLPSGHEDTVVFGPFTTRLIAEIALAAFVGRANAVGAIIRDRNASGS